MCRWRRRGCAWSGSGTRCRLSRLRWSRLRRGRLRGPLLWLGGSRLRHHRCGLRLWRRLWRRLGYRLCWYRSRSRRRWRWWYWIDWFEADEDRGELRLGDVGCKIDEERAYPYHDMQQGRNNQREAKSLSIVTTGEFAHVRTAPLSWLPGFEGSPPGIRSGAEGRAPGPSNCTERSGRLR